MNEELENSNEFLGQWHVLERAEGPQPSLDPHVWKWDNISEYLERLRNDVSLESIPQGGRRALVCENPSHHTTSWTLYLAYQTVVPGEECGAHRHNIDAFRFVTDGASSMHTVVDGEEIPMETGDLLLTPQGAWHGHENKSDQTATWLDGLTSPFIVEGLHDPYFEDHDPYRQNIDKPKAYHNTTYGNLHPANDDSSKTPPAYRYPWDETYDALQMAVETESGPAYDPYDGIRFEYVNPKTGQGPALETMSVFMQLHPSREQTETHRHNTTEIYYVVEGEGRTEVGDQTLEWAEGDSFIVPPGEWHSHETTSSNDAILFVMSDEAIFDSFNQYREEAK